MSVLLRATFLSVALVACLCANSYAVIPYIQTPYNRHAPDVTYGTTAGDYQSYSDANGVSNPPGTNDLAGMFSVAGQGAVGGILILGNTTVGTGQLITPMTNSVYGAPNGHS